jgi:hypothetical protein
MHLRRPIPAGLLAIALAGCSAAGPPIMSWARYRRVRHSMPYVLDLTAGSGALLYYGSRHVSDPNHPQVADIASRWQEFGPTWAFNEGGDPPVAPTAEEAVGRYQEAGLVRWLAAQDGVRVESIEPDRVVVVEAARRSFTLEQLKAYFVLRAVAQQARYAHEFRAPSLEAEVARVSRILSRVPGLEGPPNSAAELAASVSRWLPGLAEWSQATEAWFDPLRDLGYTNRLSRFESDFRDTSMVQLLARRAREGHRVFAVVGASHVVMQERQLRARLALP